jgi:hypothetical protein
MILCDASPFPSLLPVLLALIRSRAKHFFAGIESLIYSTKYFYHVGIGAVPVRADC